MKRKIKLTFSLLLALILLYSIYLIYYNLFYVSDKIKKIINAKDSYYVVSGKLVDEVISNNTDERLCYIFDEKKSELYCITNGERIACTGVISRVLDEIRDLLLNGKELYEETKAMKIWRINQDVMNFDQFMLVNENDGDFLLNFDGSSKKKNGIRLRLRE